MERADEVRTLSFNATSDVTEPIEQHATQQVEQARAVLEKTTDAEAVKRQATYFKDELRKAS
ncbi:MAG: hypothetical protein ACLQF1_10840 [Methyloceanibacter sp.]|jgi:hypothetical protein